VIEALQFQDKLVQNLQSIEKMIVTWFAHEQKAALAQVPDGSEESLKMKKELLENLLKAAVTSDERKTVKMYFSMGNDEKKIEKSA
jgi:hypothetical protein